MRHYLFDENSNQVASFKTFDKDKIRASIVEYLSKNGKGMVTHEKDFSKEDAKKYAGFDTINVYECNPKNGKPSKVIDRGWGPVRYQSLV